MTKQRNLLFYWGAQFLGWGLLCALSIIATIYNEEISYNEIALIISNFGSLLLISHGIRFFLIRYDWLNLKIGPLIPRIFLLAVSGALVHLACTTFYHYIYSVPYQSKLRLADYSLYILWISLTFIFWTSIYLVYHLINKSRKQELTNLQLVGSQREIELKNLRNQLNPHFLFNSLNSIRALIDLEPNTAKKSVTTLSNLLRNSLVLGSKSLITLEEEVQLVNEYLELEKVRFEERLEITIENNAPVSKQVPPFIIQTQVENALKHGISKLESGGKVLVKNSFVNNCLILEVHNSGSLTVSANKGIGIENTIRRLQLQYGDKARFSIEQKGDMVVSTIIISENESINN